MAGLLYAVAVILIVFWVIGFLFHYVVSPIIHLALVIGLVVLAYQFLAGRGGSRPAV